MATNAIAGNGGKIANASADIADINEWSLSAEVDLLEATNFASSGHKEYIAGLDGWSGSFSGDWYLGDTNGQLAMHTAALAGTSFTIKLYVNTGNYYSGTVFVSNLQIGATVGDKVSISADFTGTGLLSYT